MSVNTTNNVNNLAGISSNTGNVQADLAEADLSINRNRVDDLRSELGSSEVDLETNTVATLNSPATNVTATDNFISLQEEKF